MLLCKNDFFFCCICRVYCISDLHQKASLCVSMAALRPGEDEDGSVHSVLASLTLCVHEDETELRLFRGFD